MVQIVMLIPKQDDMGPPPFDPPSGSISGWPFVPGECQIDGYLHLIVLESLSWTAGATVANARDGRRTMQSPTIETIKLSRKIDLSSAYLTWAAVTVAVGQYPWQIYFLKATGDDDGTTSSMQSLFLTVTLHEPLVTSYSFTGGDGEGVEEIAVSVTSIDWTYEQYDEDQTLEGNREISFDMQAGTLT